MADELNYGYGALVRLWVVLTIAFNGALGRIPRNEFTPTYKLIAGLILIGLGVYVYRIWKKDFTYRISKRLT